MPSGKLIVISAPSGSGKTTIAKEIMKRNPSLGFSVSATTRAKRVGEVDAKDYFFLTKEEFKRRIEAGEFVEWEELYGDHYGTLKREVDRALRGGLHLLFDVDVKGGLSIKTHYPEALMIFIRPPSFEVLKDRLLKRQTEDDVTLKRRLDRVPMELEMGNRFDHQVVNDELDRAIREVQSLVEQHLST
ncbi:MAG TPA: guanylate kinase [Bacteroidetes bacterium]|jgi:guanylate kinase|nr:guanylate kinase [Bacteroidota bacterium]